MPEAIAIALYALGFGAVISSEDPIRRNLSPAARHAAGLLAGMFWPLGALVIIIARLAGRRG